MSHSEAKEELTPENRAEGKNEETEQVAPEIDPALLLDNLRRLQADFTNYKRHAEKEQRRMVAIGKEIVLLDLAAVQYDLERALAQSPEAEAQLRKGIELVIRRIETVVQREGCVRIPTIGQRFDPRLHEAVCTSPSPGKDDDEIPAKVVVVRNPVECAEEA